MTARRLLPRELVGDRIIVRSWRPDDARMHFEALDRHRAALKRWLPWPDQYQTPEDSASYVQRMHDGWAEGNQFIVVITHREDGRMLGGSGLHSVDWAVPSSETGYFLLPDAEGQGYMSEAFNLLTRAAFEELGIARMWATCDVQNERSWRLLERCGYTREGHLRCERRNTQGELRDSFLYARINPALAPTLATESSKH